MGKIALVTGASRGIGRSITTKFAERGYDLALNYRSNDSEANEVKETLEKLGVKVLLLKGDVRDKERVEAIIKETVETFGTIDVLVNNAGITKDNLMMRMKDDEWNDVIDINLKGTFYFTKFASKVMMKKRTGKIINMVSVVGMTGNIGQANYAASKAGVIGLTKASARELATRNICVNAVAPGFIETEMTDVLNEDIKEAAKERIPLGRFGKPDEVAEVVCFLGSDKANYITGQVIPVEGGMVI